MPIYEYECRHCNKTFEVKQSMTDAPLAACPECGEPVHKLISVSTFQLKGGGWYADGYTHAHPAPPPCKGGTGTCAHCPAS